MELKKRCLDCLEERPLSAFRISFNGISNPNRPDYAEEHPERVRQNRCMKCYSRRERAKMKLDFLDALGATCICCGEADFRFLTLDHVQNDGNKHREDFKCHQIYRQARKEGYPVAKYQVLCFNCNMGKSTNGGICPHQNGVSKEVAYRQLLNRETYIGRDHVPVATSSFSGGYDERRMQLNRRALKPCPYCQKEFGTNEMTRHKREFHLDAMRAKRAECLQLGRSH